MTAAAPDNPVYIQHLYDWLLLTPKAMEALNIHEDSDVTPGGKLERDGDNRPTGVSPSSPIIVTDRTISR